MSCYVRVGSSVQTDATAVKQCWDLQWHSGKDTTHKNMETMCNVPAWPQQCCKSCANGCNIAALHFGDHATNGPHLKCWELLAQTFDRFQTLLNNSQQNATTCHRVCKRTQHLTFNNVRSCWPTMLHLFEGGFSNHLKSER